jgi:hypothetical protein
MSSKQHFSKVINAVLVLLSAYSSGQAQGPKPTLEQQLESEYKLTTPTADNTDIVTMGSTLILQKRGFSAGAVSNPVLATNTYKDGQIKGDAAAALRHCRFCANIPGIGASLGTAASGAGPGRDFVNGEKLYVTRITVDRVKDDIVFDLISDSYGDAGRYKANLKFVFLKGTITSADLAQVEPVIAQVFKIASDDQNANAPAGRPQGQQPVSQQPAPAPVTQLQPEAPPAPIAPPPPPPPDPPAVETKSIALGQTEAEVTSILGTPEKTFKAGTKEIYQYKDVKVTFVNGKMTDVQ